MSRCRVVQPELVRLPLSDGDFIDVKKELNTGEQRRVFAHMVKTMTAGEKTTLDPEQVGRARSVEYILGWSFVDAKGTPIPFHQLMPVIDRQAALDSLDTETNREIIAAIDAHEERVAEEKAAAKNARATESRSEAISSSVAG